MNPQSIHFCCPQCNARIKAPAKLAGRRRRRPTCGRALIVRRSVPRDAEPALVLVEGKERCSLGLACRRDA